MDAVLWEVTRGDELNERAVATVTFQGDERPASIIFGGGTRTKLYIQDPRNADRYVRTIFPGPRP